MREERLPCVLTHSYSHCFPSATCSDVCPGALVGPLLAILTCWAAPPGGVVAENATDGARLALEPVVTLFTAGQDPALLLEVRHRHWCQRGDLVVLCCLVVY